MRRATVLSLMPLLACASALQQALDRAMAGKPGAAVVAGVASGRIVAQYRMDVAATRLASPGSALKPFTLLAAIESGKAAGVWACPRELRLAGRRMDCTHPKLAVPLDPATALAYSCNCYFARLARLLDPAAFAHALRAAGLDSRTGWAAREAAGVVRVAADAERLELQALGEAGIEVTPLGLLAAYRRLTLARGRPELAPILAGLEGSVEYGNGQSARTPGLAVAGKTGTSADRQGGPAHAWFAGFAPAGAPEIVVVVFLERGSGGPDAAPVAGAVFREYARGRTAR